MQIINLREKLYQSNTVDETKYSLIAWERLKKLNKIESLFNEGCSQEVALPAVDVSRSTYYRWKKSYEIFGLVGLDNDSRRPRKIRTSTWSKTIEERVYQLRKKHKIYGKYKLAVFYQKEYGESISVSMIGRIISRLLKKNRIKSVRFITAQKKYKPRHFNGHAQRKPYDMKASEPGELVQVDHMSPRVPTGRQIKHFKATCPITKYSADFVYETATSFNAARFLEYAQSRFPFKIKSIQVDGGSEFMGDFEHYCKTHNIQLYVLPPRSPELNGCVERSNSTIKREFYSQYEGSSNLDQVQAALEKWAHFYHALRPHQALQYLTPLEYYTLYTQKEALKSHMY
jgi:putative transposase